jgi:GrpB-like predicted nucleotidyltransferase (UPF0157 family)
MQLIQPYNPEWASMFAALHSFLMEQLRGLDLAVHHVGSTSVPGLAAKPIIDIDIGYASQSDFPVVVSRLETLGYSHVGDQGIPGRDAFKRAQPADQHPVADTIQHHLYACWNQNDELRRHILFRDYLRKNADARREYAALKQRIAAETGQDRKRYANLKETRAREFVMRIVREAENE